MLSTLTRRLFLARLTVAALAAAALLAGKSRPARATKVVRLRKWTCTNQDCDPYVYDPSLGDVNAMDTDNPIPPGVAFEDLPDDWVCNVCGDPKSYFVALDEWVEVEVPA